MDVRTTNHVEVIPSCPHCRVNHVQVKVDAWGDWLDNQTFHLGSCQNHACGKPVFFVRESPPVRPIVGVVASGAGGNTRDGDIQFLYPFVGTLDGSGLPDRVREELGEAITCAAVGAHLAAMTMARRVLQRCLEDKGHSQQRLVDQIIAAKNDGTIPLRYHEVADEIRLYGNIGAHPSEAEESCVDQSSCDQLIGFIRLMIEELYVLPQRAASLTRNREGGE